MHVIIDGNHAINRMYYVQDLLKLQLNGKPTGGVYGVVQTIRRSINQFNADHCTIVWDNEVPKYRLDIYPDYKANRIPKTEEEKAEHSNRKAWIHPQKILLKMVMPRMGCRDLEKNGVEGDDLIYGLTQCIQDKVVIVSEDMDLAQLVSDKVTLYRPVKEYSITKENFFEKTDCISSSEFIMKKSILGDPSDNIDGIKGMGEVRVKTFIEETRGKSRDEIRDYAAAHKSKPFKHVAEKWDELERNLLLVDLSKCPLWSSNGLMSSIKDVLGVSVNTDLERCRAMFRNLGFNHILEMYTAFVQPFMSLR